MSKGTGKIERKLLAHFIDAAMPGATQTDYVRLGEDLEEYTVSMGAQVDKKKNILGGNSTNVSAYEPSAAVDPFYAERGSPMYDRLQDIADRRLVLDDLKTRVVEAQLWTADIGTEFTAYEEEAVIEVVSYGGSYDGYKIPFNIHYTGVRRKGKFDVQTRAFTPDAADEG